MCVFRSFKYSFVRAAVWSREFFANLVKNQRQTYDYKCKVRLSSSVNISSNSKTSGNHHLLFYNLIIMPIVYCLYTYRIYKHLQIKLVSNHLVHLTSFTENFVSLQTCCYPNTRGKSTMEAQDDAVQNLKVRKTCDFFLVYIRSLGILPLYMNIIMILSLPLFVLIKYIGSRS